MSLRSYAELEELYGDNTMKQDASEGFVASAPSVIPFMRSAPQSYFGVPPPRYGDAPQPAPQPAPFASQPAPSAPGAFRDVHTYDYSYKDVEYTPVVVEASEKLRWMNELEARMTRPDAKAGLNLIRANAGNEHNVDTTNQKRAEDLLADLAKNIIETNNTDLQALLEEQLQDMYQLGQCAQGRVTRLWQLIQTIR